LAKQALDLFHRIASLLPKIDNQGWAMAKASILNDLGRLPWYVSVLVSLTIYILLTYILPGITFDNPYLNMFRNALGINATLFAFLFLIPAPFSYIKAKKKQRMLNAQEDLKSIKRLSWLEFEHLVGEYFRRKGYEVSGNDTSGADGGIDIKLMKDGLLTIVQCKQFRAQRVGVKIVREMLGLKTAHYAHSVVIVTTCDFTRDAISFAKQNNITLIDGETLSVMIKEVQDNVVPTTEKDSKTTPQVEYLANNICPKCGSELVQRKARQGTHAGNSFLGCSSFPKCRFIKNEDK